MGLREQLLRMPIEQRFTYQSGDNLFFVNLEGHRVHNHEDVDEIRRIVERELVPLRRKVYAIVNYDNFEILPDVVDEYSAMVRDLVDRFYSGVTLLHDQQFPARKVGRRAEAARVGAAYLRKYCRSNSPTAQLGRKESGLKWSQGGTRAEPSRQCDQQRSGAADRFDLDQAPRRLSSQCLHVTHARRVSWKLKRTPWKPSAR
jgi:hypothetical protein